MLPYHHKHIRDPLREIYAITTPSITTYLHIMSIQQTVRVVPFEITNQFILHLYKKKILQGSFYIARHHWPRACVKY